MKGNAESLVLVALQFLLLQTKTVSPRVEDAEEGCPPEKVRDLNGECVRRFVPPARKRCPPPRPLTGGASSGKISLPHGGRILRVECTDGWIRAPDFDHVMCRLGKWDRAVPDCIRWGCPKPPELHALDQSVMTWREELGGAIIKFWCVLPHQEIPDGDSPVLGCDGTRWNATVPSCRNKKNKTTSVSDSDKLRDHEVIGDAASSSPRSRPSAMVMPLLLIGSVLYSAV